MSNRALCATSTASPANERKRLTARSANGAPARRPGDAGEGGDRGRQRHTRVDECLERGAGLERVDPLGADLDDPRARRRETGGLEVEHDERGVLERHASARRVGQADGGAAPGEPGIACDHIVEEGPGDRRRRRGEREERARGVARRDGASSRLDELHEPIGGIEGQLHPWILDEHMFDSKGKKRGPAGPSRSSSEESAAS